MKVKVCLLSHTRNHWDKSLPGCVSRTGGLPEDHLCGAADGDTVERTLVSPLCPPSLRHRWKPELKPLT